MDIVTGVGVLDKAMTVLSAVEAGPQSLAQLRSTTALPRATAHRLATALELHGLLRRDDQGRFELGPHLVTLGRASAERFGVFESAAPVLAELRDSTGESVQLFVREGDARRCVLSLESAHGLRWIVPEGSLLPLEAGSSGRVLRGEQSSSGWIESIGEREAGVASVSAPIRDGAGAVIAAISVSGPIERLGRRPGERFGAAVVEAAGRVEA